VCSDEGVRGALGGQDQMVALFASDTQGDLMQISNYLVPVVGPKGLADIGPTLASLKFDSNALYDVKDLTHSDGKRHGMMSQLNWFGWVYNKSLFQSEGVKEPTKDFSWNGLLEASRRLSRTQDNRWGMRLPGEMYHWVWAAGANYMDPQDLQGAVGQSGGQGSAPVRGRLRAAPQGDARSGRGERAQAQLEQRAVRHQQLHRGRSGGDRGIDGKFQWEVMYPPKHPKTGKRYVTTGGRPYSATTKAKTRGVLTQAVRALTSYYDKEVQELYVSGLGVNSLPIVKSVAQSLTTLPNVPASMKIVLETANEMKTYEPVPGFLDFQRAWSAEWVKYLNGEQS
jgi:ABC-type glycerol-3-phosphate transport system substrate-binding protein